ncbi:molybdenum cofactor guanylyltransferase [Neobacillus sp. SM06]|uniref:molybdenum cofactor guanylyltransferase n=1 Tax=Neobacillus sp. SM06 TaxID=3422492 RepID=UPI003D2B23DC
MKAGAILLSGGKSSRMGTNKALLPINEQPNIERIVSLLKPHFLELILVTNHPEEYRFLQLPTVSDHYPGKGPLAGIHAGLTAATHEINAIVACDMPFVSPALAKVMIGQMADYDAVVPVICGQQHPLFSIFKKKTAAVVENSIKTDQLRMKQVLERLHVHYMTEGDLPMFAAGELERIFFNMNRPNEYEEAKRWARTIIET